MVIYLLNEGFRGTLPLDLIRDAVLRRETIQRRGSAVETLHIIIIRPKLSHLQRILPFRGFPAPLQYRTDEGPVTRR